MLLAVYQLRFLIPLQYNPVHLFHMRTSMKDLLIELQKPPKNGHTVLIIGIMNKPT